MLRPGKAVLVHVQAAADVHKKQKAKLNMKIQIDCVPCQVKMSLATAKKLTKGLGEVVVEHAKIL